MRFYSVGRDVARNASTTIVLSYSPNLMRTKLHTVASLSTAWMYSATVPVQADLQSAGVEYQDLQSDYCLFAWLSFRSLGANRNSVFCRQGFTPPAYHPPSLRDFACRSWHVRCCHRSRPSVGHDLRLIKCRPFGTWPAGHKFRVALRHCERSEAVHICFRLMKICFPFLRDAKCCVSTQLRPLSHI